MFVSLVGIDGSGKSEVALAASERLVEWEPRVVFLDKKRAGELAASRLRPAVESHAELLWRAHDEASGALGDLYWWHMQMAWFSVIDSCVVRPMLDEGKVLICDEWYHKILARYSLKAGFSRALLDASTSQLTSPDHVIMLRVSPRIAAARKASFGFAESGGSDNLQPGTAESFLSYQRDVQRYLYSMASSRGWTVIDVDERDVTTVADMVCQSIQEYRNC